MTGTPHWPDRSTPLDYVVSVVVNPGKRISVLLLVTYVSGLGGILLSVLGNPGDPRSVYGAVGVGLMGLSFFCLFGLSITMLNLTDGGDEL